jgi:predicted phage tail protein
MVPPERPGTGKVRWGLLVGCLIAVLALAGVAVGIVSACVGITDAKFLPVLGAGLLLAGAVIQMIGSADMSPTRKDVLGLLGWGTVLYGAVASLFAAITA